MVCIPEGVMPGLFMCTTTDTDLLDYHKTTKGKSLERLAAKKVGS